MLFVVVVVVVIDVVVVVDDDDDDDDVSMVASSSVILVSTESFEYGKSVLVNEACVVVSSFSYMSKVFTDLGLFTSVSFTISKIISSGSGMFGILVLLSSFLSSSVSLN